jgi:hypothetical protein
MTNIHMIWLGDGVDTAAVDRVAEANPDCMVMLHRDASDLPASWQNAYDKYAYAVQMKADLLRLAALRKYGGFYLDFDVRLMAPVSQITSGWDTLTIPTYCRSHFMPGDVLFCPADWAYWDKVDEYVEFYSQQSVPYAAFMHHLFGSLPRGSYRPVDDCNLYPHMKTQAGPAALMWRGFDLSRLPGGPGTELKALIGGWPFYITPTKGCRCNERAVQMDRLGADWCEKNIDVVSGWLRKEANRRRLPYPEPIGKALIRKAIKRARRKSLPLTPAART